MWFWRALYWLMFRGHLYFLWSVIYRYTYQRHFRKHPVPPIGSKWSAHLLQKDLTWRADRWREMFDAIAWPGYGQWRYERELATGRVPPGAFDCDDYAVWLAYGLCKGGYKALVLNVVVPSGRTIKGHHVCLLEEIVDGEKQLWHVGNWGMRGPFDSLRHAVLEVATGLEDPVHGVYNYNIVGWATFLPDCLCLLGLGFGAPKLPHEIRWNKRKEDSDE